MNKTIELNNISKTILIFINVTMIVAIWETFYSEYIIILKIIFIITGLSVLFFFDLKVYFARINHSKKEELRSTPNQNYLLEGKGD